MEIHQLEYFMAIVDTGSFSRAAEYCNVAQPSLSHLKWDSFFLTGWGARLY